MIRTAASKMMGWLLGAALGLAGCGASAPVLPIMTITPAAVSLQVGGGQQQFTATVVNVSNTSVVWKVNGQFGGSPAAGTISQTGLYQTPAAVPAAGSVTVEAVSVANDNVQATAVVTLLAGVAITLTPPSATVAAGASVQFTAVVTNATNTAVTWSVNGTAGGGAATGTITASGLYTAPSAFPGTNQVTIGAASLQDPAARASAVVTLAQSVGVTVTPPTTSVNVGASQAFTATVTGAGSGSTAVNWSVNGVTGGNVGLGTITAQGVFTAPAQIPAPPQETVTATSVADPTKSATAQITIVAPITIAIAPTTASVAASATQQFTATVTNAQNTGATWSVNGSVGGNAS
ncbi:MAG: hypothetical protein ACRD1L_12510, partial [Terriglobales bacterium]